jgi:phosphatidylinositol-3-phosphatase
MRRQVVLSAGLVLSSIVSVGCSPNNSGNTTVECRALTAAPAQRPPGWGGTVFTIVMENHNRGQIIGSAAAPYINGLLADGAEAAGYHDSYVHPSEPNYIWMVAGENFGILNDDDPGGGNAIASQSHLADQIERAGLTWKAYQESMGAPCGLSSHGTYAVKHNPFAYFSDINGWDGSRFAPSARCTDHMVDYTQLDADLASGQVPDYVFITPNMINDMHDGSIQTGDQWLSREVPKILASDRYKNGGALFLLWDEGSSQGDDPPFIVVSPNVRKGLVSTTDYDTSSFLKTVQSMLGVEPLPCDPSPDTVPAMDELFTVPLTASAAAGASAGQ